jgi:hypothetical protein
LYRYIYRQAGQQHGRDLVTWHALPGSVGRDIVLDRRNRKGVIADDSLLLGIDDNIGPGRSCSESGASMLDEPDIE